MSDLDLLRAVISATVSRAENSDERIDSRLSSSQSNLFRIRTASIGILRGYEIWTVDGEYLRRFVDPSFQMSACRSQKSDYVFPGEIWIDERMSQRDVAGQCLKRYIEAEMIHSGRVIPEKMIMSAVSDIQSLTCVTDPVACVERWLLSHDS